MPRYDTIYNQETGEQLRVPAIQARENIALGRGLYAYQPPPPKPEAPVEAPSGSAAAEPGGATAGVTPVATDRAGRPFEPAPAAPPEPPPAGPPEPEVPLKKADDLTKIAGVGPAIATALQAAGFTTYADIAGATALHIAERLNKPGKDYKAIQRERWIEQAAELHGTPEPE